MVAIWIVITAGFVLAAGMLGLTLGINLSPDSTVRYVWDWGVAGGWFSGLGAMAAAIVAVVQSHRNSSNERIRPKLIESIAEKAWSLRLVSEGLIPVTILGAEIILGQHRYQLPISLGNPASLRFPIRLERGDVQQLFNLDGTSFEGLGAELSKPIVRALQLEGQRPDGTGYRVNEDFFNHLSKHGSGKGVLLIRLAHNDLTHNLDSYLLEQLIGGYAREFRRETIENTDRRRAELRQEFGIVDEFPEQDDKTL